MGFLKDVKDHFRSKKQKDQVDVSSINQNKPANKKNGKKKKVNPNDLMSSVLDETRPQAVLTEMSREPKLRAHDPEDDTKPMYLAMMLNAMDIGGINRRQRKNTDIGSLVEAINTGRIKTYIPADLMAKQELLIIPTPATLDAMTDFTMLTSDKLKYELALVIPNGKGGADIGFSDEPRYVTFKIMNEYVTNDDTNSPNDFLNQFKFFNEADSANKTEVNDNAANNNAADQSTDNSNGTKQDTNDALTNDLVSGADLANNPSTVSQGPDVDDSSTPFSMGAGDLTNNNPRNEEDKGDIEVGNSDDNPNNLLTTEIDNEPADDQTAAPDTVDNTPNDALTNDNVDSQDKDEADDFVPSEPVEQAADDFAKPESDINNNDDNLSGMMANDQQNDDFVAEADDSQADSNQPAGFDEVAKNNEAQAANSDDHADESANEIETVNKPEQLDKAIERRFYGNNLHLEVTTKPIDLLLMQNNDIVPFDTDRGEGFLNNYLNQMSREANQSMQRKHADNISATRTFWYNQVVKGVENIIAKVDDTNHDTKFGKQKADLESSRDLAISNAKEDVKSKQDELDKHLEDAAEADAKRAYDTAKQSYLDRYRGKTEADKDKVLQDALNKVTNDFNHKLQDLQKSESVYASQWYDQIVSEATNEALNYYKKLRNNEHKNEADWRRKLRTYIDHHRKEQVAHDKALQAEIDQERESNEQQKKYDAQLKDLRQQLKMQEDVSSSKIKQLEKQNAEDIAKLRQENQKQKMHYEDQLSNEQLVHQKELAELKRNNEVEVQRLREEKQSKIVELNSKHANDLTKLKAEKESAVAEQKRNDNEQMSELNRKIDELTKQIQDQRDGQKSDDQEKQRQIEQKSKIIKNLREEINDLNTALDHAQDRAKDNMKPIYDAKYQGKIETLTANNQALQNQLQQEKDNATQAQNSSKNLSRSTALVTAVVGLILGIGGTMLMNQHANTPQANSTLTEANIQSQIEKARNDQKKSDDERINDAIDRAISRNNAQNNKKKNANNSSNSHNSNNSKDGSNSNNQSSNSSDSSN